MMRHTVQQSAAARVWRYGAQMRYISIHVRKRNLLDEGYFEAAVLTR
jgi:hypothetical protein